MSYVPLAFTVTPRLMAFDPDPVLRENFIRLLMLRCDEEKLNHKRRGNEPGDIDYNLHVPIEKACDERDIKHDSFPIW